MARNLINEVYYTTKGGVVPVKWTAPEVGDADHVMWVQPRQHFFFNPRPFCTRNIPLPVMCTVSEW